MPPSDTRARSTPAAASPAPAFRRELLVASIVIAAVLAIPLLVPSLRIMYLKSLWLDELHTWLLSRELPSAVLVDRLRAGADFNPPLLHSIDAVALRMLPAVPPQLVLRLTSVASVWIALVLLYRICRERLSVLPSAIAVMAVLAHSTVMVQIHEARFYAPWLALAVIVAWSIQRVLDEPKSGWRFAQLTLATAAMCLIHYFGVITLACLALGLAVGVRPVHRLIRPAAAVAVGTLALAAWLPVYAAQRTVLSIPTWIDAPTLKSAAVFVAIYLAWFAYAPVVAAAVAWSFADRFRGLRRPLMRPTAAQWALLGLLTLPLILVVFSYVVQPALLSRYALPAVTGMAIVVAMAASRLPRLVQSLVLVTMVGSHAFLMRRQVIHDRAYQRVVNAGVEALGAVAGDARPVVSMERWTLYPAAMSAANRNGNVAYLVLPTPVVRKRFEPREQNSFNFAIVERDATIAHNKIFGFPPLVSLDSMRRLPSFYVLVPDSASSPPWVDRFDGFRACRVRPGLLRFDASSGEHPTQLSLDESPPCN